MQHWQLPYEQVHYILHPFLCFSHIPFIQTVQQSST
jgi:hypothetical protein